MENERSGFSVIEVALVLAIAGLIFLMVFIALPSLRRSQRDTSRREDVMKLVSEIKNYQTNNGRGRLPGSSDTIPDSGKLIVKGASGNNTSWAGFYRDFLGDKFVDPDGESYKLMIVECSAEDTDKECAAAPLNSLYSKNFTENDYKMYVVLGSTCYGEKSIASNNQRRVSVLYKLEGSGIYCDNT